MCPVNKPTERTISGLTDTAKDLSPSTPIFLIHPSKPHQPPRYLQVIPEQTQALQKAQD
jgi:hypothetical protein